MRNNSYWDLMELFSTMVCDTPVPYYDTGISCGLPNEFGDIPPEMIMAPHELTEGRSVFFIHAEGDSMEDLGIYDGDMLMMESTNHLNNQCDGTIINVGTGNCQRHAFTFLVNTYDDEITSLTTLGNQWSLNFEKEYLL